MSVDDNGGVTVKISAGMVPYPKNNIERVELKERPEYAAGIEAVAQQDYQTAIDKLKPLVDKFLGIDSDWVAESAGGLAESLAQTGKTHDSEQLCDKIIKSYPNSPYKYKGMVGKAYTLIVRGKQDEALALLRQVVETLKPGPAPAPKIMSIMSDLNYVSGQAYEKKGDDVQALGSYLRVVTLYYQPEKRAQQAQARADALRKKNPALVVE